MFSQGKHVYGQSTAIPIHRLEALAFLVTLNEPPSCIVRAGSASTDADTGRYRESADRQRLGVHAAERRQRAGRTSARADELRQGKKVDRLRGRKRRRQTGKSGWCFIFLCVCVAPLVVSTWFFPLALALAPGGWVLASGYPLT